MDSKKILLIGANSYIARSFEKYCKEMNHTFLYIDKVRASNEQWKTVSYKEYDSVIMFAAIVHRKERPEMERLYMEVNCNLPVHIAKEAKKAGVKQFIFLSTAAVYGSTYTRITKDSKPKPETMYGRSKYQAEQELLELQDAMFRIAIVRPPKVYGEGCKGNFVRLNQLAKYTILFPKVHNKQSMIHVDKLSECLLTIVSNEKKGFFWPQDDTYMDLAQYVVETRKRDGKKTILVPGFAKLIRFLAKHISVFRKMFGDLYYDRTLY
ncbi:NAD-dependent epimerase/dehydratase family protein [Anaerosporobacter faecicola]|uniref:NAD-dependent epimerase/dehydratase family protein n=1 Tax=Anaerosporobacter faecicola TaxID=2718714 RepID=UPI001438C77F|nr:NAD-dependent epimerase/dehydratase family protein [Anaerosporobacter faecicola]